MPNEPLYVRIPPELHAWLEMTLRERLAAQASTTKEPRISKNALVVEILTAAAKASGDYPIGEDA